MEKLSSMKLVCDAKQAGDRSSHPGAEAELLK